MRLSIDRVSPETARKMEELYQRLLHGDYSNIAAWKSAAIRMLLNPEYGYAESDTPGIDDPEWKTAVRELGDEFRETVVEE